jgi:SPOR domain
LKDFFQSPSDKLRLEIMLKSLSQGDLNLAILGDDEVALSYYARRIYEHLKSQEQVQVDLCLSADSEKLVQRFNQILSELTLDEAMSKSQVASIRRFLIFPDTQFIQDFDLQLLARLVNGLPASNIHVILLFNLREPYEKKLSVFGKNLIQWVLEKESNASLSSYADEPSVSSARSDLAVGAAMTARELKAKSGWASDTDQTLSSQLQEPGKIEPALSEAELLQAMRDVEAELKRHESVADEEVIDTPIQPKSSRLGWGLLLGLLLSMGALAGMYRDVILQEVQNMQNYLTTPQWDKSPKKEGVVSTKTQTEHITPGKESDIQEGEKDASVKPEANKPLLNQEAQNKTLSANISTNKVQIDDSLIPEKEAILSPAKEVKDGKESSAVQANKHDEITESSKESKKSELVAKEPPLKIPVLKDNLPNTSPISTPKATSSLPVQAGLPALEKKTPSNDVPNESKAKTVNETPSASVKVDPGKEIDSEKLAGKNEWVNTLPEKAWVLQLAAMPTKAEILELKNKTAGFETAQVLLTRNSQSNKPYFILVRGPFSSKEEAQGVMQSNPNLAKAWLRSAKSLKTQFKAN